MVAKGFMKGIIIPMVTAFNKEEEIDEAKVRHLTDWLIEQRINVLFTNGSTGEMAKLKIDERKRMIDLVVDHANGRVPVVSGAGDTTTKHTIELTRYAKDAGADAAVIMPPFFWRYTADVILEHYRTVAEKVDFPIVIYDNPDSNNLLPAELVCRIAQEVPNVIALKDSSFDMIKFSKEIHTLKNRINILQGIDGLFVPSLSVGASGGVLGIGNMCPRFVVDMYENFVNGHLKEAFEMQEKFFILCNATEKFGFEEFIKQSLDLMGHSAGQVRKPSRNFEPNELNEIKRIIVEFGLLER